MNDFRTDDTKPNLNYQCKQKCPLKVKNGDFLKTTMQKKFTLSCQRVFYYWISLFFHTINSNNI